MSSEIKWNYRIRYSTPENPNGSFYTRAENVISARTNFLMQTDHPRESIVGIDVRSEKEWRRVL